MLDTTRAYGLTFLFPAGDTAVGGSLKTYGEFARPELDFLIDCTSTPGTFVDVGANIGAIALPLAKARPHVPVIAIEAHRGLCNVLAANTAINHLYNVEPVHAAGGARREIVDFPSPSLAGAGNYGTIGFASEGYPNEAVRMLRLDELAPTAAVVKIDVEGFEVEVLKGASNTLRNLKPVWLAEVSQAKEAATRETIAMFLEAGYTVHWFYAPFATPAAAKRPKGQAPSLKGDFNVVALPPGRENTWDLPQLESVDAPWRTYLPDFGYLARYGFVWNVPSP